MSMIDSISLYAMKKMSSALWILDTMSLMFGTGGQCSITKLQCSISLSKVEDGESDRDRKSDISVHKRIAGDHKVVLRACRIHQTRLSIHKADRKSVV